MRSWVHDPLSACITYRSKNLLVIHQKKKKNLLADIDLTKIVSTTELQMEHNIHYKKNKEAMYCLLTFCSPHAPLPISAV